jgi:hypothetical protein
MLQHPFFARSILKNMLLHAEFLAAMEFVVTRAIGKVHFEPAPGRLVRLKP